ncbi:MAG: 50S ribosomal protein L20 [Parcubacteria group bacterium GW2011_GWA2_51_10]|nr:MAG: 50S ribosomal protein L20 [Parcubacteria group bacterium GW2011_GWA2_51_10]
MARVKRGVTKLKRRRNILSQVKGYRFGRSKKKRVAKEAIFHAGAYAFRHRRAKKREFRNLWTLRINAALREGGFPPYSKFMGALKKSKVALDRKSLAALAKDHPESFARLAATLSR